MKSVKIAEGLELKADGTFVVAPPSLDMSRSPHRWEEGKSPEALELAARPEWLEKKRDRRGKAKKLPAVIRDGEWHKTMVSAAGTLRRKGFSEKRRRPRSLLRTGSTKAGRHPTPTRR